MRDAMKYVNHYGETFDFGSTDVFVNENDFRNYEWTFNSQYNKISSFEKRIKKNTLPVTFVGDNAKQTANRLFEIIEKDVLTTAPGRMYVGDYYLKGYFYASKKKGYTTDGVIELNLTFASDQNYWIKEYPYVFRIEDEGTGGEEYGLGYDYNYPYGFSSPISSQNFVNTSFIPANVIITMCGPVINPKVTIGGHAYQINTALLSNELLTINTRDKTAIKTSRTGEKTSVFALRNLDSYLFEKVKTGTLKVFCEPEFDFDITLLEERSEPLWI